MANCIIVSPNFIDSTYTGTGYVGVAFSGGSWDSSFPLSNIKEDSLAIDFSQTTDATLASTQGEIDLGVTRTRAIRTLCFLANNISRSGQIRIRATNTSKFSSLVVNALTSAGVSSIVFRNTATTSQTVTSGDYFTIPGDTTVYQATNTVTISASGTGTINITPNLVEDAALNEDVVCRSGDYNTATLDTDWQDVWRVVYPFGSLPYGHPSFWDGKITAEEAEGQSLPFVYIASTPFTARYIKFEIDDEENADGYIRIGRVFVSLGWQATVNMLYGAGVSWQTNSQMEKAIGGNEVYERRPSQRLITFEFDDLPESEAYSNIYEIQRKLDIYGQLVFIFDPDDVENLHRRTILARMQSLQPIRHPRFQRTSNAFELKEVIA